MPQASLWENIKNKSAPEKNLYFNLYARILVSITQAVLHTISMD
jgi:hypothetical protein